MSNALTDIAIPPPSPDEGKAFRLTDYFSDLLVLPLRILEISESYVDAAFGKG